MKHTYLLVLTICLGCVPAAEKPDFTTRHGVRLYLNGYDVDVGALEAETDALLEIEPWFADALEFYPIDCEFEALPFRSSDVGITFSNGEDPPLAGLAVPATRKIWIGYHEDITQTAYQHELVHIFQSTPHTVPYYP